MGTERTGSVHGSASGSVMDEWQWLARYAAIALVIVGGLEWLLGRTISRVAAAPTLEGPPRTIIETLGSIGFFLLYVAFMLVVALLVLAYLSLISGGAPSSSTSNLVLAFYLPI